MSTFTIAGYERFAVYSLEHVEQFIGPEPREFEGRMVKMDSDRYLLFRANRCCVECGIEGRYYAAEINAKWDKVTASWRSIDTGKRTTHFNMYALTPDGVEVLMTKDHIVPRARGGTDELSNYQTMCRPCNVAKGCRLDGESKEEERELLFVREQAGWKQKPADPNSKTQLKKRAKAAKKAAKSMPI